MQVTWDEWAVPTITGDDDNDVVRGVGFAQAVAVGGDVLELYGLARGKAASYWGAGFVEEDVFTVHLDLVAKTDEWLAAQLPETLARIEAFCAGFNEACDEDPTIGASRREVLPVAPRDVVGHMLRNLVRFNTIDGEKLAFEPTDFYGVEKPGSSSWAVSREKSTTGSAQLVINPHLSWSLTYHRFFEFRTVSPGREFHGVTLLGVPWQSMGYSPKVGWAHTVNPIRNLVVFELEDVADGSYAFDGGRRELETREVALEVKGGDPVVAVGRRSVHGPVITAPDGKDVAVRIAGVLDSPAYQCLEAWWQLSLADSVEDLFATHDRVWLPMFTMTAADTHGSIGALFCGTPPVRPDWEDTRKRRLGSTSAGLVTEVHPASAMPRVINPACGWVSNCNETPFLFTDPPLDEADWPAGIAPPVTEVDDMRPLVSRDFLTKHATVSPEQLRELKFHKRAVLADLVLDQLLAAAKDHEDLTQAVEVLSAWDREVTTDNPGYPLFWLWSLLHAPTHLHLSWLTGFDGPGTLPTGLADEAGAVAVLQAAVLTLGLLGIPLDVTLGQLATMGEGDDAIPASGGSGFVGSLKCFELVPTPTGELVIAIGDTWVSHVEFQADAAPVANSVLVYGNTTEPGAPPSPSQYAMWAQDRLRA